jgi:hypothetical protein
VRHRHPHADQRFGQLHHQDAPAGSVAQVKVGDKEISSFNACMTPDGLNFDKDEQARQEAALKKEVGGALKAAGYPSQGRSKRRSTSR